MSTLIERVKERGVPRHIALIMDGNGRWANARGLSRAAGHQAGAQTVERLIRFAGRRLGLKHLTLYAFSTENWRRPEEEINFLMDLFDLYIAEKLKEFVEEGVRLSFLGDVKNLGARLQETVARAVQQTAKNNRLMVNIALNYGARQEIVRACQRIAHATMAGKIDPERIDSDAFARFLYTDEIPDPDLIIRTSGEKRLSNFLLWQAAYSELYFTDTLWPDFTPAELLRAIAVYQGRERRFGAVEEGE
jgi:undecaprenyl diphosphate synthase